MTDWALPGPDLDGSGFDMNHIVESGDRTNLGIEVPDVHGRRSLCYISSNEMRVQLPSAVEPSRGRGQSLSLFACILCT